MNPAKRDGLGVIASGLQFYGSASAAEIMTRLKGPLSEEEVWEVIAEAERIGMIERDEMVFEPATPIEQEWRFVKGFDVERLELLA